MNTAPLQTSDILLWQESTPADYADWDEQTVADCDEFLMILIGRLEEANGRADAWQKHAQHPTWCQLQSRDKCSCGLTQLEQSHE